MITARIIICLCDKFIMTIHYLDILFFSSLFERFKPFSSVRCIRIIFLTNFGFIKTITIESTLQWLCFKSRRWLRVIVVNVYSVEVREVCNAHGNPMKTGRIFMTKIQDKAYFGFTLLLCLLIFLFKLFLELRIDGRIINNYFVNWSGRRRRWRRFDVFFQLRNYSRRIKFVRLVSNGVFKVIVQTDSAKMIVLSRVKFKLIAGMNDDEIVEPFIIWWKVIKFMTSEKDLINLVFVFLWKGLDSGFYLRVKTFITVIIRTFKLFFDVVIHFFCFIFIRKRKNFF